jgi:hypothetical protein
MPLAALGGILAGAAGTSAAATTAAWGAIGAGTAAGLGLLGAHTTAGAQESAAATQAAAQKYASDRTAEANAATLAFEKDQAAKQLATQNAIQQANYQQWAAREQRLSNFGSMLGLPARDIPAYVPIPGTANGPTGLPSGASSGTRAVGGPSGVSYQSLVADLNAGKDPQTAIDAANKAQNLQTGSSFAWRPIPGAPGGGVVEVPGGQYLTPNPQGQWGIAGTPGGESASSASASNTYVPYLSTPELHLMAQPGVNNFGALYG